jgi:hypothetical protein
VGRAYSNRPENAEIRLSGSGATINLAEVNDD